MTRYRNCLWMTLPVLLASCESMNVPEVTQGVCRPLEITAVNGVSGTRASGANWDMKDEIGVSATSSDGTALNVKYANGFNTGKVGAFAFAGENAILLDDTKTYNINAYYPYFGDEGSVVSVPLDYSDKSKAYDLMWASVSGHSGAVTNVSMEFKHQVSKVRFIVECDNNIDIRYHSVYLSGLAVKGTFSVSDTGVPSITLGAKENDWKFNRSIHDTASAGEMPEFFDDKQNGLYLYGYSVEGFVLPQDCSGSDITVSLRDTRPGGGTLCTGTFRFKFEAGKSYEIKVNYKYGKMEIGGCTITDWFPNTKYMIME